LGAMEGAEATPPLLRLAAVRAKQVSKPYVAFIVPLFPIHT
jgi:hypothetical protein